MKDAHRQKDQLMKDWYEARPRVSLLEWEQTEGKHALRTLERFEEIMSDLWGPVDGGMWKWTVGSDEALLIVNRCEHLGSDINKTGLIKLTLGEIERLVHPGDLQSLREDLIAYLDGKIVDGLGVDFRVRGKSGGWRWVRVETEVIRRDDEGRPLQAFGCFADVNKVCGILERFVFGEELEAVAKPQIRVNVAKSRTR